MNKCLYCNKNVKKKYCGISCQNHHQGSERANMRYGSYKEFSVNCCKCNTKFVVCEREKLFPQKEAYYCSTNCTHKRILSHETKEKIKNSLFNHYKDKKKTKTVKNLNCIICEKKFINEMERKTCSKECLKKLHKASGHKGGKRSSFNKKQYDENMITYIYALTDEFENIRYVGKTNNVKIRYKYHLKEAKFKTTHKEKWINSMLERGLKPDYFILEECKYSVWISKEEYWISQIKAWGFNLTNGTSGGEGSDGFKGKKHSEETKQKLREKTLYNNKHGLIKPYTVDYENNPRIKLKNNDIINIRNSYNGENLKQLAAQYGIGVKYLRQILNNKRRKL